MSRVGIIVAMERELSLLEALIHEQKEEMCGGRPILLGVIDGHEVVVMQSGIGKVSAATATQQMILKYAPTTIISSGVAGGIDESLRVMDMVVSQQCCYHDVWCGEPNEMGQVQGLPARFNSDKELYQRATALSAEVRVMGGLICTGDQFITSREALAVIKDNFADALAVDMESAAIAQVCHLYNTPFLSCRIISDTPSKSEDHTQQYNDFWSIAPDNSVAVLRQIINLI